MTSADSYVCQAHCLICKNVPNISPSELHLQAKTSLIMGRLSGALLRAKVQQHADKSSGYKEQSNITGL